MKLVHVVGARPQFIKAAVVARAARGKIIHTGQHYDDNMSAVFFRELGIPKPDVNLGIGSGAHGAQTGRILEAIEKVLLKARPDVVLVYGDTNSTLAGALAAAKLHIPVAHVEAGLRSFNRRMPEEVNRVLTDHVSSLLFVPSRQAVENLRREGIASSMVHRVGDVMYDVALHYAGIAEAKSRILERLSLRPGAYALATVHRAENTDDPRRLTAILQGLERVAKDRPVVLPLHPRTRGAAKKIGLAPRRVRIIEPLGYLDMVELEMHASVIATDSGGVQKEAYFYRVPCVTLRAETEWVELVQTGWNRLVRPDSAAAVARGILKAIGKKGHAGHLYGDGRAAQKIARILIKSL